MATYWENSCSFDLRYVSWYKYLIVSLVFSHLGFWSGNLFLIAPFPDLCLLVPFLQLMFASDDSSSEDSSPDESELVEADFAQERFLLASQAPEENLFEWADRLRVLAFKAFKGKSYSYINRLSVKQFCLECLDQKAGRYALDHNPETMDDALDYIKQCFMTYRQKQSQMSEASRPRDVTTDGQNIVQSQQNQLPAESPVCDSHIT